MEQAQPQQTRLQYPQHLERQHQQSEPPSQPQYLQEQKHYSEERPECLVLQKAAGGCPAMAAAKPLSNPIGMALVAFPVGPNGVPLPSSQALMLAATLPVGSSSALPLSAVPGGAVKSVSVSCSTAE